MSNCGDDIKDIIVLKYEDEIYTKLLEVELHHQRSFCWHLGHN